MSFTSKEIKRNFLAFFKEKGHHILKGSSLIPANDNSLLFVNSGMVQFKDLFRCKTKIENERVASIQKCLRVGGKHNDFEHVGYSFRHHTFFEMLGNFSFGNYFKEEACLYALQFLKMLGLDERKIFVTVFEGTDLLNADIESEQIWLKLGIPRGQILRKGMADNFWSMGEVGVCGPCTELYYNTETGLMEIWNLVFMQYEKLQNGKIVQLPMASVDTGMGLERVCAILNGVKSAYETDLFIDLIKYCETHLRRQYTHGESFEDRAMRICVDHGRAISFLIADGVLPSNEGRGYVLRRLIRRAVQYIIQMEMKDFYFYKLCEEIASVYYQYEEIEKVKILVGEVVKYEEEGFKKTLESGIRMLDVCINKSNSNTVDGSIIFKLHDTYGLPPDLAEIFVKQKGKNINWKNFNLEKSKVQTGGRGLGIKMVSDELIEFYQQFGSTTFIEIEKMEIIVVGIYQKYLIFNKTPFYAESGGQEGDVGYLMFGQDKVHILDTKKEMGVHLHLVEFVPDWLKVGVCLMACVDVIRRDCISRNHTATHLLHSALKLVLGNHVMQKGSLVSAKYFRFDFSYFEPLTIDQVLAIEDIVFLWILENHKVDKLAMSIDEAKNDGYIALFHEKYERIVQCINIGRISKELCGGTHAVKTGDLKNFRIQSQKSVAFGVRRIEALTGSEAMIWSHGEQKVIKYLTHALNVSVDGINSKVDRLLDLNSYMRKQLTQFKIEKAQVEIRSIEQDAFEKNTSILMKEFKISEEDDKKYYVSELKKKKIAKILILAFCFNNDRWSVLCIIPSEMEFKVQAINVVNCLTFDNLEKKGDKLHAEIQGKGIHLLGQVLDCLNQLIASLII